MNNKTVEILFNEEKHEYTVNSKKAKISVTALVDKQVTKTEWFGIDPEVLRRAAERGTFVHADLEHFIRDSLTGNTAAYEAFTKDRVSSPELTEFSNFLQTNNWTIKNQLCEFKMAIEHTYKGKSFILSGTADLICTLNNKRVIVDHKTTSTIHTESVRWQLSLLDYMARILDGCIINGTEFHYEPAEEFYVFHFNKQHKFTPVKVDKIPDVEIIRLLDAEAQDEEYHPTPLDILTPLQQEQVLDIQKQVATLKFLQDKIKKTDEEMRKSIIQAFEAHPDVKTIKFEHLTLTYTPETTTTSFDTESFKKDYPELFEKYQKNSTRKASVTITLSKEMKAAIEANQTPIPSLPLPNPPQRKNSKRGYFA